MLYRLYRFRSAQRRLISAVIVLGVTVGSFPLQISVGPTKDFSKPFPCQHRACGCRSAEQCAKKCCCFTPAQKLAWARQNGVALAEEKQPAVENRSNSRACCQRKGNDSCVIAVTCVGGESGCCRKANRADSGTASTKKASNRVHLVVAAEAQQCGGVLPLWMTLGDVCPPKPPDAPVVRLLPSGRIETGSETAPGFSLPPPVPPPRIDWMPAARVGA